MYPFFRSLFAAAPPSEGAVRSDAIRAAIERVVDGIDPRLRAVPRYQRILWQPVEHALACLSQSVDSLPPAIPFDPRVSSTDSRLRALFVDSDHLLEILSASTAVRGFLQKSVGAPPAQIYVALRTERKERRILGMSLEGDAVMRDVPQTTVSFHNHRVAFPAAVEAQTRRQVRERALDYLIEVARHRLSGIRARRQQLEQQQRQLLQGQARASGAGRPGWNERGRAASVPGVPENPPDARKLREIEGELGRLRADSATLSEQLALVAGMLAQAQDHVHIDPVTLTLDHLNVLVPPHSRRAAEPVTFNEMVVGGDRRITLETIRFPSDRLLAPADLVASAQRVLRRAGL